MDFVQTLPNNISKQILAGLEYTKKKMPTDLVATTVDVSGPQVTPPGSPIDGQVAKSAGAPVEKYITLVIDTSEFDEDQEVVAYIGDSCKAQKTAQSHTERQIRQSKRLAPHKPPQSVKLSLK